ncbi:gamma-glutamyltransferase family protein [Rhodoplanes sp. TEM]|uniref:Gamma-glutamyltransferase family protein n=1 Tax=Rhodoplanes tepidamans TaxID=200616 RepID=A0ABT5JBH0_RHOTP|nr:MULTISPECIES: gamma-glutamyltransferase family protein [Rhodoplanes]MDC7786604.1 gamma-glutamyltransferase family protein [Rhodoplanes tepidamans]MDC7983049.1 gamma-glutamyltransferase family protein [Rhodoplanes sp. TEM]MDQ0356431.1 gamma-glutamyltranspeptidase/glutathione hydrolase [Rhodoplanes tepidamans]
MHTFTTRPEIRGTFGAIATTHWIASAVGMSVLERGGNAFDAAAAAGFVLQIVEPHLVGPGGDLPIILKAHDAPAPVVICGQGPYPAAATREAFGALGLAQVPGTGLLPSVVPGSFDAWMLLLRDYGTWTVADVLAAAIGYAETGFPVLPRVASSIYAARDFFKAEWPTSAAVWLPGGEVPRPRALMRTPAIAATYRRIVAEAEAAGRDRVAQIERARDAFYRGFVAEAIDRFYATAALMDSTGRRNRGLLTGDDLARYSARVEPTVSRRFGEVEVHKTGPWGQGPVMLETLALLDGFDLAAMDPAGPDFVHVVVESMKLAYADREVFYGDPDVVDVPLDTLLSDDYAAARRALIGETASTALRPGDLAGAAERMARVLAMAGRETPVGLGHGEPTFPPLPVEWGDTVHLDVVDRFGNMISATPSGGWLQSSPVVPGIGFPITTRGQMGWLEPGHPSTVRPGARPRTTLTPTLVTRDGEACLAIGTPGGDQQDQWVAAVLLRHLVHGLDLQAAIDAPLFTCRHFPQSFYPRTIEPNRLLIEERFGEATLAALRARGHDLKVEGPWSLGRVCAVARRDGMITAAATPRLMQAYAIGR